MIENSQKGNSFAEFGAWSVISHMLLSAGLFAIYRADLIRDDVLLGMTLLLAAVWGLLQCYPIYRSLKLVEQGLLRLSSGQTIATLKTANWQPMYPLLNGLNDLAAQQQQSQAVRGQWVRQIGEVAAQEERNRLARDLHDSIKQQIFSINVSAAAAQARMDLDPAGAQSSMLDVKQSAQEALVEMRVLLQQLSPAPLEKSGLLQSLRDQCEAIGYRTGAQVHTEISDLPPDDQVQPGAQEMIFRIVQEALSNVARHARAENITLRLHHDNEQFITLEIEDDGQGFDMTSNIEGMGLGNIRDRASHLGAQLSVVSAPGHGTKIKLTIPLIQLNEEEPMNQSFQSQFKAALSSYQLFTVSLGVMAFSLGLLLARALNSSEPIGDDPVLAVIQVILLILGIGALPVAFVSFFRSQREGRMLLLMTGEGSPVYQKLRRYVNLSYAGLWLFCLWMLPIMWVGDRFPDEWPLLTALFFFGLMLWNYFQSFRAYHAEMALMTDKQRDAELENMNSLIRGSWTSLFLLIFVLVISDIFRNGLALLPQTPDEWTTTAFIFVATLLVINQVLNLLYYRWWQQRTLTLD